VVNDCLPSLVSEAKSPCGMTFNNTEKFFSINVTQVPANKSCVIYMVRSQNDSETTMEVQANNTSPNSMIVVYVGNYTNNKTSHILQSYKGQKKGIHDLINIVFVLYDFRFL